MERVKDPNWKDPDPTPEEDRLAFWREVFPSGYFWCLHCGLAFRLEDHREAMKQKALARNRCICGAFLSLDGVDWDEYRMEHNTDAPSVPIVGREYPH